MAEKPPVVLTIAGFDPSSGAGVTADIKTIAAHGCYGVACITALTVQSTSGVRRVEATDPVLVLETLEELASDVEVASIHIGMLASAKVAKAVATFLAGRPARQTASRPLKPKVPRFANVVLDPVLQSSSGTALLDTSGAKLFSEELIRLVDVITPNVDEAAALAGMEVRNLDEMRAASSKLHDLGAPAVVITGGHLEKAIDLLSYKSKAGLEQEVFKADRQNSNSTHGTGCAFATAIACQLALGRGIAEAVLLAKTYVSAAISNAHPLGHGTGPVHHLYRMAQQRRSASTGGEP